MEWTQPVSTPASPDGDEFAWLLQQAGLLRAGRLGEIDRQPLAEFLTDMAGSHQDAVESAMKVLLQHLLKIAVQPDRMTRSWGLTVLVQQDRIQQLASRYPGLRQYLPELYAKAYSVARRRAAYETGIDIHRFPAGNPWTMDEALTFSPPAPQQRGKRTAPRS